MGKYILISIMSLLIVGSCSRVTQGLVQHLASQKTYEKITILDLLPVYDFHYRFYRLQKQLASQQNQTKVGTNKLYQLGEFAAAIKQHRDLLFVTHDYFQSVTSKTKLMEVTANLSGQRNIVFASPLEYDHFGLADPVGAFQQAREKVIKANPNATFVRSDIQDSTEFLAYLHGPKSLIQEKLFKVPESFHPNIASSSEFNEAVASALKGGSKGETHLINGQPQDALSAPYNRDVHPDEFSHHASNVEFIFKKYRALPKKESKSA